ncbi:type I polyketide synthase [Polyangium sp. 6x1]|uniref:type I polyketide synthase n=1 Tax=Polyangium sp. 6x1 TaxID=3042689 RepID=UPI002482DEAD|nr:type I polyketide synthase [Polyangium sp. 6x1]MDI1443199.1 type I polyketide synthase [Polyangium sp. 6x1]
MTTRRPDAPSSMTTQHDDDAPPASGLSSMQRAIMTIQKMRAKIENLERARVEPIAIIGMGCRFPGGANTPEAFFEILKEGVDAITEVPPERWKLASDHSTDPEARAVRWGAFLRDVDLFDARFFGISPREASKMDPQQRILLEVTWEALERAGQVPERLVGSRTGVFLGIMNNDYAELSAVAGAEQEDAYTTTGNGHSFPAGRVSYTFGFQGPSVAIDTACSSSLVAIHLACQSLRTGECNLAVAGGVNLMLVPSTTRKYAKTQALSPDGRCKSFDATANGFVRGEGCGMLVLKRLSDAERDGDPILAVVRGSAVNQDGRSTGLTTPNVLAQQAMLTQALESARVAPSDIGYVETHGTGTSLGDPIEMDALKAVLGGPRPENSPCVLGALKTNIGHLEAAAGVAGVIKTVLVLQNATIPRNNHFRTLNPRIQLDRTSFVIPTATSPWRGRMKRRIAGVSSFGMSGTNAHVVVEEWPASAEEDLTPEPSAYLLPLSAKSPEALLELAGAYRDSLATSQPDVRMRDVVYTASQRRAHFEHRLSVVGGNREETIRKLDAFLRGDSAPGLVTGKSTPARAKVVFVFSGQGSQWLGMGRKLYEEESAFRSVIDSCDALMTPRLGWSLLDELDTTESMSRLGETQVAQPLIFAIQVALVELLRSWGVAPDAVIGHSVGEIAAAYISGILTLDEAVRLVAIRGRIMQKASGIGKMVSVALGVEAARMAIAGYEDRVSIAAVNDPGSVVLAGQASTVDEITTKLEREGVSCRALRVNYAFHSPQMEPLAKELVDRLVRVDARRATLAMYSTVLAECVEGKELDVRYWGRNVRETVDLAGAVSAAIHDGYQLFLEVGPHPVLAENVRQILAAKKADGIAAFTLRRNQDDRRALLEAAGALYTRGCFPEWARLAPGGAKCVPMPTYRWQRERYWLDLPNAPWGAVAKREEVARSRPDPLDACVHAVEWRKVDAGTRGVEEGGRPLAGPWLIFADSAGVATALARQLDVLGEPSIRVVPGERYESIEPGMYRIDPGHRDGYRQLLRDAFGKGTKCRGVIHLFSLDAAPWDRTTAETLDADQRHGSLSAAFLLQAILQYTWRDKPKLWLVTRGAQHVPGQQRGVSVSQAPLWGLARTANLEHPELSSVLVDLPPEPSDDDAGMLLRELGARDQEDRVALRPEGRYVARLVRSSFDNAPPREFRFREDAVYLITGGLGGLGSMVARWMVTQGARHLALAARSEPNEAARDAIRTMEEAGARVLVLRADVSRPDDVAAMLEQIDRAGLPLRGVVHAAGAAGDKKPLLDAGEQELWAGQAAKTRGAWNVHKATLDRPLDFFVLYSSASAVLGLSGHAGYSSANAFLDALAEARSASGGAGMSIQWGAFADAGLAAREGRGERMAAAGMGALKLEEGPRALGRLLERPRASIGIFRLDVRQWLDVFPQAASSAFWSEVRKKGAPAETDKVDEASARLQKVLAGATPLARRALLEAHVREQVAQVFRMEPARIDTTAPFATMGADSLISLELKNNLERSLGLRLPATLLFTYSTMAVLVEHLLVNITPEVEEKEAPRVPDTLRPGPMPEEPARAPIDDDDLLAHFDATMQSFKEKKR